MNFLVIFFRYFILFLIYSFIGWLFEVFLAIVKEHKFINRGFLIGPIVPIWGTGAILITLILKETDGIFNLLVSSAFIGTFLEYVVNVLMEKLFKARWWDYSDLPFNVNGRVWLGSSVLFGIGGMYVVLYLNPFFLSLINFLDSNILIYLGFILLIIVVVDFAISCNIIKRLKLSAYSIRKDYTEEVSKKVRAILREKSHSFNRLIKAFPDVNFLFKSKKN